MIFSLLILEFPVCDPAAVENITIELQSSWQIVMRKLGFSLRVNAARSRTVSTAPQRSARVEFDSYSEKGRCRLFAVTLSAT
jgi:hypothetical protein